MCKGNSLRISVLPLTILGRFFYDEETTSFTDIPADYTTPLFEGDYCQACISKAAREQRYKPRLTSSGLELDETAYHKHDFVYLVRAKSDLFEIAQIQEIEEYKGRPSIKVRYLQRHVERQPPFTQETIANPPPTELFFDDVSPELT